MNSSYPLSHSATVPGSLWRKFPLANPFSRGTYRVWQRNRDVFFRTWKTSLWPPFVEALLTLLAFGFGLGVYIPGKIDGMTYLQFIAPGLIMNAVLFTASFECLFGTYFRMEIQKTFAAIIATPISLEDVISAEVTWAATHATLTGTSVLLVLAVLHLTPTFWVLLIPLVTLLTSFLFASMAIVVTSLVSSINSYNYYITLAIIPMQLFSGIFFPLSRLPAHLYWIVYISPAYPAVKLARDLFTGHITIALLGYTFWLAGLATVFYLLGIALMRRRLIR